MGRAGVLGMKQAHLSFKSGLQNAGAPRKLRSGLGKKAQSLAACDRHLDHGCASQDAPTHNAHTHCIHTQGEYVTQQQRRDRHLTFVEGASTRHTNAHTHNISTRTYDEFLRHSLYVAVR